MGMDHYRILKQLGGTTGTYLAVDRQDGARHVVIKRLVDGTKGVQELNVSLRVRHPNIIPFLESFVHDGALYVVLAYAEGGDLEAYLERLVREKKRLPVMMLLRGFKQLIEALQCCHSQNIMHRDLKPGNVFLNADATELYLGDFGSAKALLRSVSLTSTFVGSPIWISPELLTGQSYSYPSDIWSLGCVFYEMATMRQPFSSNNFATLVQQITSGDISPFPVNMPEDIRGIIMSMLQVDPNKRCSLARVLELTTLAIAARTPTTAKVAERTPADAVTLLSPPPPHVPKRALEAAMKAQQKHVLLQQRLSPMGETTQEDEEEGDDEDEDWGLSVWLHARKHDVSIIERYLKKFRPSDELVLGMAAASPPSASSGDVQREKEVAEKAERVALSVSPNIAPTPSSVVRRVEPRPKPSIVNLEFLRKHNNDGHRHGQQQQQQHEKEEKRDPASRRRVIKGGRLRKKHPNDSHVNRQEVSPFARQPSMLLGPNGNCQAAAAFKSIKSSPSACQNNSPESLSPHGDDERQLHREKREQERAKMLQMIRERKAKAMQERKAKGKGVAQDVVSVEIVLPDNVRYVEKA